MRRLDRRRRRHELVHRFAKRGRLTPQHMVMWRILVRTVQVGRPQFQPPLTRDKEFTQCMYFLAWFFLLDKRMRTEDYRCHSVA